MGVDINTRDEKGNTLVMLAENKIEELFYTELI